MIEVLDVNVYSLYIMFCVRGGLGSMEVHICGAVIVVMCYYMWYPLSEWHFGRD